MASKNSIPVPPPLKIHSGELVSNWKRFKSLWQNYELATDINGESKQKRAAIFLSCIGPDAYDVFCSMALEDDARADIDDVIRAFDAYCIGEVNPTYERYVFNKRYQETAESFDGFVTELRRLAKSCDFGQLEETILMDRIVIGIRDDATRRKLLQTRKLTLTAAIDIAGRLRRPQAPQGNDVIRAIRQENRSAPSFSVALSTPYVSVRIEAGKTTVARGRNRGIGRETPKPKKRVSSADVRMSLKKARAQRRENSV